MNPPAELQLVSDQIAIWHAFDRSVKADLFSTAVSTKDGTVLIDPIALDPNGLSELQARSPIAAIIVTNQNHWRASGQLSEQLSVPIFAHAAAHLDHGSHSFSAVAPGHHIKNSLEVISVAGAAPGEIAIFSELGSGSLIIGDALINFEPYGFTFLPPKYCDDHGKMRRSLRQLGDRDIQRIFFAHGLPILSAANSRLRALINAG